MTRALPNSTDYARKPKAYYANSRPEMQPLVPRTARCVLDVGCGSGGFGAALKAERDVEVWGIEPVGAAVALAAKHLDHVIHDSFPPAYDLRGVVFDCVVFNDVLEHMVDPGAALRAARALLAPGGVVVASIPNIRHLPTLWRLVVHGEWTYRDSGTLDKTHLRFFTRASIVSLFEHEEYQIQTIVGINAYCSSSELNPRVWRAYRITDRLLPRKLTDLRFLQFAIVAAPRPTGA